MNLPENEANSSSLLHIDLIGAQVKPQVIDKILDQGVILQHLHSGDETSVRWGRFCRNRHCLCPIALLKHQWSRPEAH